MDRIKLIFVLVVIITIPSCQLVVVENKTVQKNVFIANRQSPLGVLNLYLMQLDSNDVYSATFLKTDSLGNYLLPIQQYELLFPTHKFARQIARMPITKLKYDTLSADTIILDIEFDYIRNVKFLTSKINNKWYIAEISSKKTY